MQRCFTTVLRLGLLVVLLTGMLGQPQSVQAAVPAGFSEFFLAGGTDQLFALLRNNDNDPQMGNATVLGMTAGTCTTGSCNRMHSVVTVVIAADNTTVYYDHWENGYGTGTASDEAYTGNDGDVLVFESANVIVPRNAANPCSSTNPSGGSTTCYDGRDRIYAAGGAIAVAQAFWPEVNGTVYANAWEIYPIKPYQTSYTIPVGEDLDSARGYADFDNVYILAQATQDGTVVTIDDPTVAGVQVNVTLNRGETTQYFHANTGTTVTGSNPVQVQFIVGQPWANTASDSRSYTAVPNGLWDTEYYSPVPSDNTTTQTDIYIYNPTSSVLGINYQDTVGSGTISIPANSTRRYSEMVGRLVPENSAVILSAANGTTKFWAIGSHDTEDNPYNYGFSLIPASTLESDYFIGWAPGTTDFSANGSPVFVTPTENSTTVFVDYSPTDGIVDATYIVNRLQVLKLRDPDNNNTGMHIWATAPIALVWGEDDTFAAAGNPYIDAGYAILPLKPDWIDVVVTLDKTSNPSSIAAAAGQVSTFTVVFDAGAYGLEGVYVEDVLPANWAYLPGTTSITWPGGSSMANPTGGSGPSLSWGSAASPIADLLPNETLTLIYQAQTTGVPANYSINTATGIGTYGGQTFEASDNTTVVATLPDLSVTKTNNVVGSALVGIPFNWSLEVLNSSSGGLATFASGQVVLRDNLPAGANYGMVSVTNGATPPAGTGSLACSIAANVLICTASGGTVTLPTGASFTASFPVTPAAIGTLTNPVMGGSNVCRVDPYTVIAESDEANNNCSNSVTVVASSMSISKTANPANGAMVNPGDTITYTITVNNTGGTTQNSVVVNDALPVGTTYVAESTSVAGITANPQTVGDAFNAIAFTGNQDSNGAGNDPSWNPSPGAWTELSEADGANAGYLRVVTDLGANYSLRIQNANRGVWRNMDLSSCASATLSLDYRRNALDGASDFARLSIGEGGIITHTLADFAGPTNDAAYQTYSVDITSWIDAQTRVQLRASNSLATTDNIFFDNILITCNLPIAATKDNLPAGANPDLTNGAPPTLVTGTDGFILPAGASMTVTYAVTVDNPAVAGLTSIVNMASVSSDQQLQPLTASTTHSLPGGTISGQVRNDVDQDGTTGGIADVDDSGLAGATVTLYTDPNQDGDPVDGVQVGSPIVTDAMGNYSFTNIPAGTYVVVETDPANYTSVMDKDGDTTAPGYNRITVRLPAGASSTGNDFLDVSNVGLISGAILADTNNDDTGDAPLAGVILTLYTDPNGDGDPIDGAPVTFDVDPGTPGIQSSVQSLADGSYTFANVPAGSYVIVETQPAGYLDVSQGDITADVPLSPGDASPTLNRIPVNLAAGETDNGNTFVEEQLAVIGNLVWNDLDSDGIQDPDGVNNTPGDADDEVGLSGVTVNLLDSLGNPIDSDPMTPGVQPTTTLTNISGYYSFTVPPGSYILEFVTPVDYTRSPQHQGGDDALDSDAGVLDGRIAVVAVAGAANNTVDAGMYQIDNAPQADPDTDTAVENGPAVSGNVMTNETSLGDEPTTVTAASQGGTTITIGTAFPTDGGGSLTLNADGTYSYTPPAWNLVPPAGLVEVFTYTITDVDGDISSTTLTITVSDNNRTPTADDDTNATTEDIPVSGDVTLNDVLSGDGGHTWNKLTDPGNGTVAFNADGTYIYTPNANWSGTDSFTYEICDADNDCDPATVTITVQGNPSGLSKVVVDSNETSTTNPDVAIGEIVTYRVSVIIPPGVFANARLVDTMESGLSYMDCVGITPNALATSVAGGFAEVCAAPAVDDAGSGTTVDVGRRVTFDLDTLTNPTGSDQTLSITYRAVVLDSAANASGVNLHNSARWTWGSSGSLNPAITTLTVAEPELSILTTADTSVASVGSEITITLTIQHTTVSESNAYDAVITNVLPAELHYVPGSLECASGLQDADVLCAEANGTITAQWSNFALGDGNGQVTFRVTVLSLPPGGITNIASVAWTSLPGVPPSLPGLPPGTPSGQQNSNVFSTERDYDPASPIDIYGTSHSLVLGAPGSGNGGANGKDSSSGGRLLPATGFAPNQVTDLGNIPPEGYSSANGVTVEIPALAVKLPVVGVPLRNETWNVSWLGRQAGWLAGSAFPSWNGNSVLTGHVYLPDGLPGPFVNLSKLNYGDKIIVRAYGQKYTFEVREKAVVAPNDTSILKHEEKPWLTLVTCKEYDEKTNTYRKRVVIRAVLVSVVWE